MLRHEWGFEYTAAQLLDAANRQLDFRNGRVTYWEQRKAEVIERIKASGISVSDTLALADSNNLAKYMSTHGRRGPQITIDTTMQADLDECFEKIRHHAELRAQYKAWVQVFAAQPADLVMELHHDDWMFFFGK